MSNLVPALKVESGDVLANSRDVANIFGRQHQHVLRDIDQVIETAHGPDLDHGWFRLIEVPHPTVPGRNIRSFDMTKDGFTLLVMGYTGPKAMQFKVAYINEFNRMEAELRKPVVEAAETDPILAVASALAKTSQAIAIIRRDQLALERTVAAHDERLAAIEAAQPKAATHVTALEYLRATGRKSDIKEATALGRQAARRCRLLGIPLLTVADDRFGTVNAYPVDVLDFAFLIG